MYIYIYTVYLHTHTHTCMYKKNYLQDGAPQLWPLVFPHDNMHKLLDSDLGNRMAMANLRYPAKRKKHEAGERKKTHSKRLNFG